jgi:dienelactone hydrolase
MDKRVIIAAAVIVVLLCVGAGVAFFVTGEAPDVAELPTPQPVEYNGGYDGRYTLAVTPPSAPRDTPLTIRAEAFEPGQLALIRAETTDASGRQWRAEAVYEANAEGVIDVSQQAPVTGTYNGVAPMGLIWSMQAQGVRDPRTVAYDPPITPEEVVFELAAEGEVLASARVERLTTEGLRTQEVRTSQVTGTYFHPLEGGPYPAVIVLGGSEGGIPEAQAAMVAAQGYAVLALGYFSPQLDALPNQLNNIPVETVTEGVAWLLEQPQTDADSVMLYGNSRGAELALLTATLYPEQINGVIATVPAHVVWMGLPNGPAWTHEGEEVPYVAVSYAVEDILAFIRGSGFVLRDSFEEALTEADAATIEAATIPVEQIDGPVLLISAGDDQLWPSPLMGERVMERLEANAFAHPYELHTFEGAGHLLYAPYQPTTGLIVNSLVMGGTPAANAEAHVSAWELILTFLDEHLR